jgi:hypothetical protein
MSYKVKSLVISDRIPLDGIDPSNETYVVFQRPARWEAERIYQEQAKAEIIFNSADMGTVRQRERVAPAVIESMMVAMCLVESNLAFEGDELIFTPGKNCRVAGKDQNTEIENKFFKAWYKLPDEVCEEIIAKLQDWHPPFNWGIKEEE